MKAKEFIPASKPRNFVAKNQKTAGAGAHKDKKRAEKQGDVKHKKQAVPMEGVAESKPGWMLKQDPKLAAKVKAKTDLAKKRQASYGDPSAGKKFNDNPDDDWSQEFERRMKKGVAEAEKKPYPKTWHDVDPKLGKQVDKMSQAEKVKKGFAHPDTLKKKKEQGVAESISVVDQDYDLDQVILTLDIEGKRASFTYTDYDENFENAERRDVFDQLQNNSWYKSLDHPTKMEILDAAYKAIRGEEPSEYKPTVGDEPMDEGWGQKEFEIGGYTYMTEIDEEEDNRKIFHMIKTPDGKTVDVDFTPYAYMSKEDVKLYVKLGMPKRQGIGPLDSEKLQKMAQIKGIAMLDREMARAGMSRNG